MVERLCAMADLPKPRIAVVPTDVPNAFATGRNPKNAVVAVTEGLWNRLEPKEVEGVLAHELSHIANRDVAMMTVASFFAMVAALLMRIGLFGGMFGGGGRDRGGGTPVWLIMFLVAMLTYVLSYVLILMISRYREYAADRGAALITGAPENLMSALQKIAERDHADPAAGPARGRGHERVLHRPDEPEVLVRRALHDAPAAREAARPRSPRSRARWAARSPPRWASLTSSSGASSSRRRSGSALRALDRAVTLEAELGLKPAGRRGGRLQAALGRRVRPGRERDAGAARRGGAGVLLEDRAALGRLRLRVADRPRRAVRGPRHDRPPRRLGVEGARLRRPAARGALSLRPEGAAGLLDLRLQARRVLAVRADRARARSATTPRSSS